ncbi:hypothetical protein LPJ55_005331 [Coemansia sp. RSA 990]|nr:hypothetical protein LPJ55_005331 [Coemansia sp. RSA 990]
MPKSMLTLAYFSQTFRGMMATRHIKAGDPLIKVPERLLITASKVKRSILLRDPQLRSSIQTLTEHQLLVYWVYIQNSAHSWTEWAWYVKTLPKSFDSVPLYVLSGEMPSENILLASDFEKWLFDHLPHSVQLKVIEQQRRLYGDWKCTSSLQGSIVLPTDWRRYVWAWLIVNTRCIHLGRQYAPQQCVKCITQRSDSYLLWPICDCDSIALAPVLDLLNHSCHASVLTYFDTASRQFVIKTLLPYSKGQEAFISYGPHENGFMLAEYGFVIANNPYSVLTLDNKVEEWVSSAKNSLSKPRRSLLDAKNLDRLVEVLQSNGMWGDFTLRESEEELPYRLQAAMLLLLLTTVLRHNLHIMSQPHNFTSPSRRGTPSTSEPIPYFNGNDSNNTNSGEAGFYSTVGLASTANYQQTTFTAQQQRQSSMQHLPYGVPPRCATGPAVETPYQNYVHSVDNPYAMASRTDPYRSASVVYGGNTSGYSQLQTSASAAAATTDWTPSDGSFFDQFANTGHSSSKFTAANAAPIETASSQTFQTNAGYGNGTAYSEQYTTATTYGEAAYNTAATASTGAVDSMITNGQNTQLATVEDTSTDNGVVFDQASGQYYDMNSGQYYDNASGMWYYPDHPQASEAALGEPEVKAPAVAQTPNIASPEPVSQDNDASFFDNLASVLPPAAGTNGLEQNYSDAPNQLATVSEDPCASFADTSAAATTTTLEAQTGVKELSGKTTEPSLDAMSSTQLPAYDPSSNRSASETSGLAGSFEQVDMQGLPASNDLGAAAVTTVQSTADNLSFYEQVPVTSEESEQSQPAASARSPASVSLGLHVSDKQMQQSDANRDVINQTFAANNSIIASNIESETTVCMEASALGMAAPIDAYSPVNSPPQHYSQNHDVSLYSSVAEAPVATSLPQSDLNEGIQKETPADMADYQGLSQGISQMALGSSYPSGYAYGSNTTALSDDSLVNATNASAVSVNAAYRPSEHQYPEPNGMASELEYSQAITHAEASNAYASGFGEASSLQSTMTQHAYSYYQPSASQGVDSGSYNESGVSMTAESTYYGHDPYSVANGAEIGSGISDPLGRLSATYPLVAFGFGGRLVTMFPQQVQRFNNYSGSSASKVAPGMLSVYSLNRFIPIEHGAHNAALAAMVPLVTGDVSRSGLEKRREAAIATVNSLLNDAEFGKSLSAEEHALYNVVIAVLRAADQPEFHQHSFDEAVKAIRPLFSERPNTATERTQGAIAHGSAADIQQLERMLLDGKRSDAISFSRERGLWAHALIIASCTGKKDWQDVVSAYVKSALDSEFASLGMQYRLFAGLGGDSLAEAQGANSFITAAEIGATSHRTDNPRTDVSDTVADWARLLSMTLANRTPGDQAAILRLGDQLREHGQVIPAHICYVVTMLAREIFQRDDGSRPRAVLLGVDELTRDNDGESYTMVQTRHSQFYRKPGGFFLTELFELALALRAACNDTGSNRKATFCLPHLQKYKLLHAWWLVDCGQLALASQYCDALLGIIAINPTVSVGLVQELRSLRERLSGAGMTSSRAGEDAALAGSSPKSWLARAVPRPSFTSLMTAVDSSIDKLITGIDGSQAPLESTPSFEIGPGRHTPLPASQAAPHLSVDARSNTEPPRMYTPSSFTAHATPPPAQPQWGDPGIETSAVAEGDFIVPGMALSGVVAPAVPAAPVPQSFSSAPPDNTGVNDDEDIFGFTRKKTPATPAPGSARHSTDMSHSKPASARPSIDNKDAAAKSSTPSDGKEAGGVLGILKSFWGGRKNQANLGEESHFVYDPVQQRWVDKNAPASQQDSGPPPPPPPSMMNFRPQSVTPAQAAPVSLSQQPGSTTAATFSGTNGVHSPSEAPSLMASTNPSRTTTPIPPAGMAQMLHASPAMHGSSTKRRSARSRYVDVLNQ